MKTRNRLFALTLGATMLASAAVQAADPIKIGTFLSVTGPASFLGDPELRTLQMYVDELNAGGGVLGRKIELVHYDTAGQAKEAVNFVKRLIQNDAVDVIVGGSSTGDTMAAIPEVEKAEIPLLSLAGGVEIVEPVKKWVFKTPHTDRMAAIRIFEDMKKRGIRKVALITGDGGFDKSGRKQVLELAPKYGLEIVAEAWRGR
jgi:branched-chain amino acid transport system substrate-binding protein